MSENFYKIYYEMLNREDIVSRDGMTFVNKDAIPMRTTIHNVIESKLYDEIDKLKQQFKVVNQKFKISIEFDRDG